MTAGTTPGVLVTVGVLVSVGVAVGDGVFVSVGTGVLVGVSVSAGVVVAVAVEEGVLVGADASTVNEAVSHMMLPSAHVLNVPPPPKVTVEPSSHVQVSVPSLGAVKENMAMSAGDDTLTGAPAWQAIATGGGDAFGAVAGKLNALQSQAPPNDSLKSGLAFRSVLPSNGPSWAAKIASL
jgi:hypothetical protein